VYKVVGIVKRHFRFREPGAESRALREAGVYRQALDAADGSPQFLQTKRSFVLFRILSYGMSRIDETDTEG
jgi:hypothetical protein